MGDKDKSTTATAEAPEAEDNSTEAPAETPMSSADAAAEATAKEWAERNEASYHAFDYLDKDAAKAAKAAEKEAEKSDK